MISLFSSSVSPCVDPESFVRGGPTQLRADGGHARIQRAGTGGLTDCKSRAPLTKLSGSTHGGVGLQYVEALL